MSLLDLFKKPRIVQAALVHAPVAITGGRTLVRVVVEGAGVLTVGDVRIRFLSGFDDVVRAPIADAVGRAITLRVRSLVGSDERTLSFTALPALAPPPPAPVPLPLSVPALGALPHSPRVRVSSFAITAFPRGTPE